MENRAWVRALRRFDLHPSAAPATMTELCAVRCAWSVVSDDGLLKTEQRLSCWLTQLIIPERRSNVNGGAMIDSVRFRLPLRHFVVGWFLSILGGSAVAAPPHPALSPRLGGEGRVTGEKPNIVILLCDDLGYGDLSCFAHPKILTPHLDKLATEGVKLTHCYSSSPVCSPSRAGLMTGRVPNRLGIRDWIPADSGIYLRPGEVTIAQLLKEAGYHTCHAGKWHLNSKTDGSERTPGEAGFDHWLYTQNNASPSHLNPTNFVRNGKPAGKLEGPSSHLVVAEAIQFLDAHPGQPFFLNLWFHESHEPVAAAEEFR